MSFRDQQKKRIDSISQEERDLDYPPLEESRLRALSSGSNTDEHSKEESDTKALKGYQPTQEVGQRKTNKAEHALQTDLAQFRQTLRWNVMDGVRQVVNYQIQQQKKAQKIYENFLLDMLLE